MNNARRKAIQDVKGRIETLLCYAADIASAIEAIRDAEQEYRDRMPASLTDSEKGQQADVALEALDGVLDDFESLIENPFAEPLETAAA